MIVAVSTIKDTVPHVEKFVHRNLGGGVDHLIVFLDTEQPEVEEVLAASPHVTCVTTHSDWWHGERQAELNDRQRTHATLAVRMLSDFAWVDWMFHVDRQALAALPDDVRSVRLATLEAVAEFRADRDPTWFKAVLDDDRLALLAERGLIARAHNRAYFRGHMIGKVGVRPAPDIRVAIHSAADADEKTIPALGDPAFTVLHYEAPTGEEFVAKWRAAAEASAGQRPGDDGRTGRAARRRRRLAVATQRVFDLDLPAEETDARLERVYRRYVADDVEALRELGVLQHHDPDTWVHDPEPLPPAELGRWADAVARLRAEPKSACLPPSRRDAPLEPASGSG
jgi:hypothetical protein